MPNTFWVVAQGWGIIDDYGTFGENLPKIPLGLLSNSFFFVADFDSFFVFVLNEVYESI